MNIEVLVTKPGTPEREFIESVKKDLDMSDYQVKVLITNFRECVKFKLPPKLPELTDEQIEKMKSSMATSGKVELSSDSEIEDIKTDLATVIRLFLEGFNQTFIKTADAMTVRKIDKKWGTNVENS